MLKYINDQTKKNVLSTSKRLFNVHRALLSKVVLWAMQHLDLEGEMTANQ